MLSSHFYVCGKVLSVFDNIVILYCNGPAVKPRIMLLINKLKLIKLSINIATIIIDFLKFKSCVNEGKPRKTRTRVVWKDIIKVSSVSKNTVIERNRENDHKKYP